MIRRIFIGMALAAASLGAMAQALTDQQVATLRTNILADPALAPKCVPFGDGPFDIAAAYNLPASPAYTIWRAAYTPDQKAAAIDNGITQLDGLTGSKREVLLWWANRTHDARLASTQAAMIDMTGSQNTLKAALQDGAKRPATRAERVFAAGTGSAASPGVSAIDGALSVNDVQRACNQ
jgi:hypothetical protein